MKTLRLYQSVAVEKALDAIKNWRKGILVLPTGAGKSLVCSEIIHKILLENKAILLLTHDCRIIAQNHAEFVGHGIPPEKIGIYCAELKSKEIGQITIASIQSYARLRDAVKFDVVIIDEAHRIPHGGKGQYGKVLADYAQGVGVIGLTATAYRQTGGLIVDDKDSDKFFDVLIHEVTQEELIEEGYLTKYRYVADASQKETDFDSMKVRAGEYEEEALEKYYSARVEQSIAHILKHRQGITLVFGVNIKHVDDMASELVRKGIDRGKIAVIHSASEDTQWKGKEFILNCNMLTTGFNYPDIKTVAIVRATKSTSLWVQMCGRGSRLSQGKDSCLVIDLGCNCARHDKAEKITTDTAKKMFQHQKLREQEKKWSPYRVCTQCDALIDRRLNVCECGKIVERKARVEYAQALQLSTSGRLIEPVESISIKRHTKAGSPDSLRLIATLGGYGKHKKTASTFFCFDHQNPWVKSNSRKEFLKLIDSQENIPDVDAVGWALDRFSDDGVLCDVSHVEIKTENGFPKIVALISSSN